MGLDEVGRGCLSGPVVAAGVILPPGSGNVEYRDSKSLTAKKRERLAAEIRSKALFCAVRQCEPGEIDRHNILRASLMAMQRCVVAGGDPDFLLVDGNRFGSSTIPLRCVVGGDRLSASIAAASIVAKVYRDALMRELHREYPWYGWDRNAGYPTREHYDGLFRHGYPPHHRRSFRLRTDRPCQR